MVSLSCNSVSLTRVTVGQVALAWYTRRLSFFFFAEMHQRGAEVVATDMNAEKLKELKAEVPAIVTDILDVTKGADVEAIIKKHSNINVLFNCAG